MGCWHVAWWGEKLRRVLTTPGRPAWGLPGAQGGTRWHFLPPSLFRINPRVES